MLPGRNVAHRVQKSAGVRTSDLRRYPTRVAAAQVAAGREGDLARGHDHGCQVVDEVGDGRRGLWSGDEPRSLSGLGVCHCGEG